jgi:biopolymer transport protein ExbD
MAFSTSDNHDDVLSEINITPLVDVMLVLLIVFIITTPLLTNAIKVNLPRTAQTESLKPNKTVTVSVDPQGHVYIDKTEVGNGLLEQRLIALKKQNGELTLSLQADQAVPYGSVAKVMASIQRAGVDHLSILTINGQ